jgi:hypothetical protein
MLVKESQIPLKKGYREKSNSPTTAGASKA